MVSIKQTIIYLLRKIVNQNTFVNAIRNSCLTGDYNKLKFVLYGFP